MRHFPVPRDTHMPCGSGHGLLSALSGVPCPDGPIRREMEAMNGTGAVTDALVSVCIFITTLSPITITIHRIWERSSRILPPSGMPAIPVGRRPGHSDSRKHWDPLEQGPRSSRWK